MEKLMLKYVLPLVLFMCNLFTSGDILIDQIGTLKGEGIGEGTPASQYFEPKYIEYDIAVLDNFTIDAPVNIHTVEVVIDGWQDQWTGPSAMSAIALNIYSTSEAASLDLVGDVATAYIDIADVQISRNWFGDGDLLTIPTSLDVDTGTLWISIIPVNSYADNGQTGVKNTLLGDGVLAWHSNPNGGFNLPDNFEQLATEAAFRLLSLSAPEPCELALPEHCPEDINADGYVNVLDILQVIASFGTCGDGTFRPVGDIAPLPYGDCCVNVLDILAIIEAWGEDCTIRGGCCLSDGTCSETLEVDCALWGGQYFGDFTICETQVCETIACCITDLECQDVTEFACIGIGATVVGDIDCSSTDCSTILQGDNCSFPFDASLGAIAFDITSMTASQPQPDPIFCQGTQLNWSSAQKDAWYSFVPLQTSNYSFSLCDSDYNSSLVLYEGNCNTQVACNGDGDQQGNCHPYYAALDFELEAGVTYVVRIGGSLEEVGSGTLVISLNELGACCIDGVCVGELYESDCELILGDFFGGGTSCEDQPTPCTIVASDECLIAADAYLGLNFFDTTAATPSTPEPDESQCVGTFLDWEGSSDIWFKWTAPENGRANFSTCDNDSYDTSIVLYENNCLTQVGCNGDGLIDIGCQLYYSYLQIAVTESTDYFIRIGSGQEETGAGILTISYDFGVCCIIGTDEMVCKDTDIDTCSTLGGTYTLGVECTNYICEIPKCQFAIFSQNPHSNGDDWVAGTSTFDSAGTTPIDYERAELVNVPEMDSFAVWGFPLTYEIIDDEGTWEPCAAEYLFTVRQYDSDSVLGLPLEPALIENIDVEAVQTGTGDLYAGIFELRKWELPFPSTNVAHISVQSQSTDLNCWFLWMSSGSGDGRSSFYDGEQWLISDTDLDLSICIE